MLRSLWKRGYVLASKYPAEIALAVGGQIISTTMVKELLRENRDNYYNIVKEDSPEKRHEKCGCLAKSDMVPISCVDDLQAGDCRSEGYEANMKLLGDVKDMCLGIAKGTPTHSGAKTIAFTHTVLGSALAWVEQLKIRCETLAVSYIRHEEANQ